MTTKIPISKLTPIIVSHILPKLPASFTLTDMMTEVMTHLNITEDAWGNQISKGKVKGTWVRYNISRATSNMALKGEHFVRDGKKKSLYVKVTGDEVKPIEPVEEMVVEILTPVEEPVVEVTEEVLEDMDSLLDDIFDDVKPVIEEGGGESFELPTPPEDTSGLDAHLVDTLKEITGCYGYYSARASKCKECPLAHHCAKELGAVMDSISKTLLA